MSATLTTRHPRHANIERVAWQTGKPLATGTRLDFVGRFWGRTLSTPTR
jgi:hypothetical protein